MCDTFVALRNATRDNSVIFGKNSDRDPNEAHELVFIPHQEHPKGEKVNCTYISIPQVEETNAVLLSKPFWIWGAEMGANEHGVVIGNEAVFTKISYEKGKGLIGMDHLRLALERAATAEEALEVLIWLLEEYDQGGNCGFSHPLYYHNSYLIADSNDAWVFETAGRHWAAQKVKDIRSISNVITIGSNYDRADRDLVSFAMKKGWCKNERDFEFNKCYSDLIYTTFGDGRSRQCRTTSLLEQHKGAVDIRFAQKLLRDHGTDEDKKWQPGKGVIGATVCAHASFGPIRISQTTGSFVAHLAPEGNTYWVTGTAAPCTSTFKPVWFDGGIPDMGLRPGKTYDKGALWWQHEDLHREILRDYASRIELIKKERDALEERWLIDALKFRGTSSDQKLDFSTKCFNESIQKETEWYEKVKSLPVQRTRPILDRMAWNSFDRAAQRDK
jgi:dipeptidase